MVSQIHCWLWASKCWLRSILNRSYHMTKNCFIRSNDLSCAFLLLMWRYLTRSLFIFEESFILLFLTLPNIVLYKNNVEVNLIFCIGRGFSSEESDWGSILFDFNWYVVYLYCLTLSWRRPLSYRNQSIDLQSKSMDWFLYDTDLRHERVNVFFHCLFSIYCYYF